MSTVASPHGVLEVVTRTNRAHLSRKAKAGDAMRIATGLYIVGATLTPEQAVRDHLHEIVAAFWPGGVLCGRTAFAGGVADNGELYIAHPDPPRKSALVLPGVTVHPVVGPLASPVTCRCPTAWRCRAQQDLVDNIDRVGRPARSAPGSRQSSIESTSWPAPGARHGSARRRQLDVIAGHFDPAAVTAVRTRLTAVLGSISGGLQPLSDRLRARLAGDPFDGHPITMMQRLVEFLGERPPNLRHVTLPVERWNWLPFFEAYLSNFIEGTEFGVDEARRIALEGVVPENRRADAHDVAATYRLATDPDDRRRVPTSGDELIGILSNRHRVLMAAPGDKHPGELKQHYNFAGGFRLVEPALVGGTLKRGSRSSTSSTTRSSVPWR